jgi:putative protease
MGIFSRLLESLAAWLGKSDSRPPMSRRRMSVRRIPAKKKKIKPPVKVPKEIAVVTHYFPKAGAAAVRILSGEIKMGDKLLFQSKTASFIQQVNSLQINRIPIEVGRRGEEVGLKVKKTVHEGDKIYKG